MATIVSNTEQPNSLVQPPYLSSSLVNSTSGSQSTDLNGFYDLIMFLEQVQRYTVDLLPITSNPGLGILGDGATSQVAERVLNSQRGLAFKQAFSPSEVGGSHDEVYILKRLAAELSILAFPPIRNHPNIVRLEGICWELCPGDIGVLPVFVFEKANHGDLHKFMCSHRGAALSSLDRLKLCAQVSDALTLVYAYGFIHGDIKPKNVLVYEDNETLTAKIADFGFSARLLRDDTIQLPKSRPWFAPEYHQGKFNLAAALKADIFSFGMLCLWVLFKQSLVEMSQDPMFLEESGNNMAVPNIESSGLPIELKLLEQLKTKNKLVKFAHRLVESTVPLNEDIRCHCNLKDFFTLTLARDPENRAESFPELTACLLQKPVITPVIDRDRDSAAVEFRLTDHLNALQETDYRTWRHIATKLERHFENSNSRVSALNCAFQLAFCYKIGFGVRRNEEKVECWLKKSQRPREDLEIEKRMLKPNTIKSRHVSSWYNEGYVGNLNHVHEYQKLGSLEASRIDYENIIRDWEEELGQSHFMVLFQKEVLSQILEVQGRYLETETLLFQIWREIEKDRSLMQSLGWEHLIHCRMARILRMQRKLDAAESWATAALEDCEEGSEKPHHLVGLTLLGGILCDGSKYKRAERVLLQAVNGFQKTFGERHNMTHAALTSLAHVYTYMDDREKFLEITGRAFELAKQTTERRSEEMIGLLSNRTFALMAQTQYLEAKRLGEEALKLSEDFFGIDNQRDVTIIILGNLGYILRKLGDSANSEILLHRAIKGHTELFSADHPKTLEHIKQLAELYEDQKKFEDAEQLYYRVVKGNEKSGEEDHPQTLEATSRLSIVLQKQGKFEEAERLCTQALKVNEERPGPNAKHVISLRWTLGQIYNQQWNYQRAEAIYQQCYDAAKSIFEPDYEHLANYAKDLSAVKSRVALQSKASELGIWPSKLHGENTNGLVAKLKSVETAAQDLQDSGDYARAEDILLALLLVRGNIHGLSPPHPDVLKSFRDVAVLYTKIHKYASAHNFYSLALGTAINLLGERHPESLAIMHSMAYIFQLFGKYQDADQYYGRACVGYIHTVGLEDSMTLKTLNSHMILLSLTQRRIPDEVEEQAIQNLRTRERLFKEDSEEALESMNTLTNILSARGHRDRAGELNRKALDMSTRKLGACHPITLRAASNRVANLAIRAEYKAAEALNTQILSDIEKVFGEHAPETLEHLGVMGMLQYRLGRFEDAERTYVKLGASTEWSLSTGDPMSRSRFRVLQQIRGRVADPWGFQ